MNINISFVIPLYNEEKNIVELYNQIINLKKQTLKDKRVEIIFINDGSTDNSLSILKKLSLKNTTVKIISFRRNLGKASALNEGFKKAIGKTVVTLDCDLQDDPRNIPILLKQLNTGYDLVTGWRKNRFDPLSKIIPSKTFNFLVGNISKIPLHDFNSGLKVMRNEVAKELYLYGGQHRFIPVLAYYKGFKVSEVPTSHHPRKYGKSKYGGERLLRGFFDFVTVMFLDKFEHRPLQFFGFLGTISILFGLAFSIYLSVLHFMGEKIGNRPLLTFAVLLIIAGLQVISIGFIAEMIVRKNMKIDNKLPIDYETE